MLEKGHIVKFLDYEIRNSMNSDGLVLYKPKTSGYECHLGNFGPGSDKDVNNAKRAAIIYFMLARPEPFATTMYYRAMGRGGQYQEYYLLRNYLQLHKLEMPVEITPGDDGNSQIYFNNKPLNVK